MIRKDEITTINPPDSLERAFAEAREMYGCTEEGLAEKGAVFGEVKGANEAGGFSDGAKGWQGQDDLSGAFEEALEMLRENEYVFESAQNVLMEAQTEFDVEDDGSLVVKVTEDDLRESDGAFIVVFQVGEDIFELELDNVGHFVLPNGATLPEGDVTQGAAANTSFVVDESGVYFYKNEIGTVFKGVGIPGEVLALVGHSKASAGDYYDFLTALMEDEDDFKVIIMPVTDHQKLWSARPVA